MPDKQKVMEDCKKLSDIVSVDSIGWRYDGILSRKLKRESHCIFVQLLKRFYKCGKALTAIRLVRAEDAVKTFPAVIRDPRKLSAVVV